MKTKQLGLTQKYCLLLISFLWLTNTVNAQETTQDAEEMTANNFWKNVQFGGGLGLGFGNGYTTVGLSPSAIYVFNKFFAGGIGLNGNYSSSKNDFSATVLGGSIIGLFKPIDGIVLSAEFEELNVNFKDELLDTSSNYWYPALFIGGGYNISNFGSVGIRFDILYNRDKSIYGNALAPFIRYYF